MHYLYYVAVEKEKDKEMKSLEIKRLVQQRLDDNNFASDSSGFWGNCKADWYVIGGRWSGQLSASKLDNWYKKAGELINSNKADKNCSFFSSGDIEKNAVELQKLWESLGGKGTNNWNRDSGYDTISKYGDDAMLLDEKLYQALVKDTDCEVEVAVLADDNEYVDDEMPLTLFLKDKEKVVGNYYIVVVDYHN